MSPNLELFPTSELVKLVKRNRIERAIGRSGCLLSILLAAIVWVFVFHFITDRILPALFLCSGGSVEVALLAFAAARYLADFRLRHQIREINRRFGRLPVRSYISRFARQPQPGESICLFEGAELPHGRKLWGSLWIREGSVPIIGRTASREICGKTSLDPWDDFSFSEYDVPHEKTSQLSSLIERNRGIGTVEVKEEGVVVMDGFPVTVAIVPGDGSAPTVISANLCGIPTEQNEDDRIRFLELVASIICDEERDTL